MSDTSDPDHICRVCHQPIPRPDDRRQELLVHRACLAELRCGVTLCGSTDERTRELDTV
ncbi:hypothetical protein [Haloarcula salinisoli]|uniref:Uncharacterized protein n=1 Tax=Haloarcula salinisoli TaxID=2487746 RepID=A0A8J8C716_9EURY|nr:hypothetical protein [Halomicroarcula salinisoli]MBX0285635.1 hypothetical protein [Halomicroarcula salinisoli]MBX0302876.1 hypothetical protein [Halomicroarcula salinisoli]